MIEFDEFLIQDPMPLDADTGKWVTPENPCEALVALAASGRPVTADGRHTMKELRAQCQALRAKITPTPPPPPKVKPGPLATPPAASAWSDPAPEPATPLRVLDDTAFRQGAATPAQPLLVIRQPTGHVPERRPTDPVFAQKGPIPPAEVAWTLSPLINDMAKLQALQDRLPKNEPEPGELHPSHAAALAARPTTDGDPVDLFTGAQTYAAIDLVVPTPFLPIRLERRYRSGRPYYGPFGYSWDHNFNVYLRRLNAGGLAVWTGALHELTFEPSGPGWAAAPSVTARIEAAAGGPDTFEMTHPHGVRWIFERPPGWAHDERIPLTRIIDRHGNRIDLSYDTENRVAAALDVAGRGLRFLYGGCGLLEAVSDHTGGRVVRYHHDGEVAHLVRIVQPATASYPDGLTTQFVYDVRNPHPAMQHNLLRIVGADRRTILENTYGGPEAGWAFNGVIRQLAGDFEWRFDYAPVQEVPEEDVYLDTPHVQTSVRRPDGGLHIYTFNWRGDLLDHRFRLNRDGTARICVTTYRYDPAGNLAEQVGPDGARVVFTYDYANIDPCARRNLLHVDLAEPIAGVSASRRVHECRYEDRYQLPEWIADETGARTHFAYDLTLAPAGATGRLLEVRTPPTLDIDGNLQAGVARFEVNDRGQPIATISPAGRRTEQAYALAGPVEGFLAEIVEDPAGIGLRTQFRYDAAGHLSQIEGAGGRIVQIVQNALGQTEAVGSPAEAGVVSWVRRRFDDSGALVRQETPSGAFLDTGTVPGRLVVEIERDGLGAVRGCRTAANTAQARHWRWRLDEAGRPLSAWDPLGRRTDRVFGENGVLLREVLGAGTPLERTTRYACDVAGRVRRVRDASGRSLDLGLDGWGRVTVATLADGTAQAFDWGPENRLLESRVTGPTGLGPELSLLQRQSHAYDARGRLISSTAWAFRHPTGGQTPLTTAVVYDADDNVVERRLPHGARWAYAYDAVGRLAQVTDPLGARRRLRYDASGDLVAMNAVEIEAGVTRTVTRTYQYDGRGRLRAAAQDGLSRTRDLDDRDLVIAQGGTAQPDLSLTYNAHGEPVRAELDPGGLGLVTRYVRNAAGEVEALTDPAGWVTRWARDGLGQVSAIETAGGARWTLAYGAGGQAVRQTRPSGAEVTLTYDAPHGRPTTMACVPGPGQEAVADHVYAYDGLGRLVRAQCGANVITRRFDSLDRLVEESFRGVTIRRDHDDLTGHADLIHPDGRRERVEANAQGQVSRIVLTAPGALGGAAGDVLVAVDYGAGGRAQTLSYRNGVVTRFAHDERGRLVTVRHSLGAATLSAHEIRYDAQGHRAALRDESGPAWGVVHRHDAIHRLVGAQWGPLTIGFSTGHVSATHGADIAAAQTALAGAWGVGFVLDPADVRLNAVGEGGAASQTYGAAPGNRIAAVGAIPVLYDADGARLSDDRFTFSYDALGRLRQVRDRATSALEAELKYDPLSRPFAGLAGGVAFEHSFFGGQTVQVRRAGVLAQISLHGLLGLGPPAVTTAAGTRFPHFDASGSTSCVTDDDGDVTERHRFGIFGAVEAFAADGTTPKDPDLPPIWRGMPHLARHELYQTPARTYDAATGAFLTPDRWLYADSPSPYVFAGHDPSGFADPSGLAKVPLGAVPEGAPTAPEKPWRLSEWLYEDSKKLGFAPVRYNGDIIDMAQPVDTGNTALNYLVNTYLTVCNLSVAILNTPTNLMHGAERGARWAGFSDSEIQGFYDMSGIGLIRSAEVFEGLRYLPPLLAESGAWLRSLRGLFPPRLPRPPGGATRGLPMVAVHYDPVFKINPHTSNWLRWNYEWVMEEHGYFERGVRLPEDGSLRRLARDWVDTMGEIDRVGDELVAMHPIDDFMAGMFRRPGEVGTSYYFGESEINRAISNTINLQLYAMGITRVGQRFGVVFENFPSFALHPPIAPYASPPNLTRAIINALKAEKRGR